MYYGRRGVVSGEQEPDMPPKESWEVSILETTSIGQCSCWNVLLSHRTHITSTINQSIISNRSRSYQFTPKGAASIYLQSSNLVLALYIKPVGASLFINAKWKIISRLEAESTNFGNAAKQTHTLKKINKIFNNVGSNDKNCEKMSNRHLNRAISILCPLEYLMELILAINTSSGENIQSFGPADWALAPEEILASENGCPLGIKTGSTPIADR